MDIGKKLYQELTAKQRAIAYYSAINRDDHDEVDRLLRYGPRERSHVQAILALGQALDFFNLLTARATTIYLALSGQLAAALSFCSAWLAADGALDDLQYRGKVAVIEKLTLLSKQSAGEVEAIWQAAREWCNNNQIPTDFFSGPLCALPMPKELEEQSDSETLWLVRSAFEKITLSW
ncbi:MAG: hypothetical protein V2B20_18985 [Pseudomonadota bacterium]